LLDDEAVAYLRRRGTEVEVAEGEAILRRGDTGQAFWAVLHGEVEVRLRSADGESHALARLGPGETFGELAILRAAPASADVVAVTPVTTLRYPAEYLATALAECEPLRRSLLTRLAHNLYRTTTQAWGLYRQTQTFAELYQGHLPSGAMVAVSGRMRRVARRSDDVAQGREPVLVRGEPGTGKMLTARMIHEASPRRDAPLIAVDCRELSGPDAATLLFGGSVPREDATDSFGALHLAHEGTLVLRGIEALRHDLQLELARHLEAEDQMEAAPFPDVRLIATLDTDASGTGEQALVERLGQRLTARIELPTLAERSRDIVPLARTFLHEIDPDDRLELTPSAEHALVSLKYRHRNVDELRSVVELAARVADGDQIRAEHVFSGYDSERPIGLNVSRFWLVRWLVDGGGVHVARLVVAGFFLAQAVLCLAAGGTPAGRVASGLVWWVWEPAVFALFLLLGSVWCTVCPLSSSGRLVQRLFSLERPPPAVLQRAGTWLSAGGFVLILWSEEVFHMVTRPFATGVLLVALVASAVVCCVLWQREVWCRHLCPLGRLGVALSPVAPLTVAARRSVCTSTCTTHDCYKGNEQLPGCPVYHHPQLVSEAHRCKTCLTCLASCPHGSAGLYLRPRLRSAWRLVSAESYVVPFALTVALLSPVLAHAQRGGPLAEPLALTLACLATMVGAALLAPILGPLLQRRGRSSALTAATACAILVLGWGPLMAYQMGHIPVLASLSVVVSADSALRLVAVPELSVLTLARVAFVVFAAALSAIILWNAQGKARHEGERIRWSGWSLLIAACTAYTALGLWLAL
jgi:CRP-like cAMP-binding protein/polyferredoxin